MRLTSVYVIPCLCGDTVESHTPTAQHACDELNQVQKNQNGDFCLWPRKLRSLVVDGWGKV